MICCLKEDEPVSVKEPSLNAKGGFCNSDWLLSCAVSNGFREDISRNFNDTGLEVVVQDPDRAGNVIKPVHSPGLLSFDYAVHDTVCNQSVMAL